VLLNIVNILESIVLVVVRKFSRSTGLRSLDDLRKSPSGAEEGCTPFGDEEGEDGILPPSGEEVCGPPSVEKEGRFIGKGRFVVRGDRKDASGPLPAGR
jgi:hypothetical protein